MPTYSAVSIADNKHAAISINAMDLENGLRDVQTNCLDRLHVWLFQIVGASPAYFDGTRVPVEGPFTASLADIRRLISITSSAMASKDNDMVIATMGWQLVS